MGNMKAKMRSLTVQRSIFDLGQNHNISFAYFSPFKIVALDVFGRKSEYNLSIC